MVIDAEKNKKLRILGIIGFVIMCVGVFLPFVTVSYYGFSKTSNYILNDERIADGIFILVFAVIAIILMLFKKKVGPLILTGLSLAVPIYDIVNASNTFGNGYPGVELKYGIGCYIIFNIR